MCDRHKTRAFDRTPMTISETDRERGVLKPLLAPQILITTLCPGPLSGCVPSDSSQNILQEMLVYSLAMDAL